MELTTDVIFLFLSTVSNDLFIYYFIAIGMGCEIKCVGTTESIEIPFISGWATCTIKFNIKKTFNSASDISGKNSVNHFFVIIN